MPRRLVAERVGDANGLASGACLSSGERARRVCTAERGRTGRLSASVDEMQRSAGLRMLLSWANGLLARSHKRKSVSQSHARRRCFCVFGSPSSKKAVQFFPLDSKQPARLCSCIFVLVACVDAVSYTVQYRIRDLCRSILLHNAIVETARGREGGCSTIQHLASKRCISAPGLSR